MESWKEKAALLKATRVASPSASGASDVIDFGKRLRDGCKVSYISGARVTEADADDWMALPLLKEKETEATCSRRNFLLLHVPSLREFLHKLDALPPSAPVAPGAAPEAPAANVTATAAATVTVPPLDPAAKVKCETPDVTTTSTIETSAATSSTVFTDDVIDEAAILKPTSTSRKRKTKEPEPPALSKLRALSPFEDSSYFEPDDVTTAEELRSVVQNDLSPLADYFASFGEGEAEMAPYTINPISPAFSLSSVCSFKIEPTPLASDCPRPGSPFATLKPTNDSATALQALISGAAVTAATAPASHASRVASDASLAIATAYAPDATRDAFELPASLADDVIVADLPLGRRVPPLVMKKKVVLIAQSPCPRCYVMIEKLEEARAHIEEGGCTAIGNFACDVCAKRMASKWTLKKHYERHREKPRCVFCSNRFDSLEELRDHNLLSGHMFRPEEASPGSADISELRKARRQERKNAEKDAESANNLSSVIAAQDGTVAPEGGDPSASSSSAATAPSGAEAGEAAAKEQPAKKKRKSAPPPAPIDEAAAAAAAIMEEKPVEE